MIHLMVAGCGDVRSKRSTNKLERFDSCQMTHGVIMKGLLKNSSFVVGVVVAAATFFTYIFSPFFYCCCCVNKT